MESFEVPESAVSRKGAQIGYRAWMGPVAFVLCLILTGRIPSCVGTHSRQDGWPTLLALQTQGPEVAVIASIAL